MISESLLNVSSRPRFKIIAKQTIIKEPAHTLVLKIQTNSSIMKLIVALVLFASQFASFGQAVITEASAIVNGIEFTYVESSGIDFFGGMVQCRLRGGELASIRNQEEFDAVEALANLVNPLALYYIGRFSVEFLL